MFLFHVTESKVENGLLKMTGNFNQGIPIKEKALPYIKSPLKILSLTKGVTDLFSFFSFLNRKVAPKYLQDKVQTP